MVSRLGDVAALGVLEPLAVKISLYAEFFHLLTQIVKLSDVVRVHRRVDAIASVSGVGKASDTRCGQHRSSAADDGSETNSSGSSSSTSSEDENAQVLR